MDTPAAEAALVKKLTVKLIPFLFFLYVIAYLDRVNVGFAKLEMTWFSESVYGFGAGIFFIGYFLFEVPSNLILHKVGARRWIARIMFTWGLLAIAMALAHDKWVFYTVRFLLGVAEAGFFPGVLLYLTYWFTTKERARMVALFMTANAVTFSFGGPLSGMIMKAAPIPGLAGWQQMFVLEGIPAVLMTFVVLWYLPDGPKQARWLSDEERELIAERIGKDSPPVTQHASLLETFKLPGIWTLCGVYFCFATGMYGISLWIPQLVKTLGKGLYSPLTVGLLCAIPYAVSGVLMVVNAAHSDRTRERRKHIWLGGLLGTAGLVGYAVFNDNPVIALTAITLAATGMWSTLGPFWALPPAILAPRGAAALAGGIAMVNSVGNLGGFIGPYAFGFLKDATKNPSAGVFYLAASVLVGAFLVLKVPTPAPVVREDLNA